ncbi:C1 family peptidase [Legionella oakridgensis]|uniref:C1 family peptidase n=1 Tax=Legionella oakridgensis TaxID=29423 RepID=UPI0003DE395E|nr:C1 family peptidase [Legionella oakridgensis]ETO94494.1 cysteine protease [Legionella oakridgensis RV-2-2007]
MKLSRLYLLMLFISGGVFAQDIEIVGHVKQSIPLPSVYSRSLLRTESNIQPAVKQITLLKLQLSDKAQQTFRNRAKHSASINTQWAVSEKFPGQVQLGMNNVPVMDQGSHGTCATFANTAAVDAALGKGDYISQLCQLQLGRYLENNAYSPSGWDGSLGRIVLNQMEIFGVVNKEQQKTYGCGGFTDYPSYGADPDTEMSLSDYHQLSEDLSQEGFGWSPMLDIYQAVLKETDTSKILNDIKLALHGGERVTFGVLLVDYNLGVVGAVGKHKTVNDTWVLTPEIMHDLENEADFAGHEMIITGYDDNAVAIDNHGRTHRGLLTLRNSWGADIGNKGDFYMSYDYFKSLAIEAQRIRDLRS